MDIQTATESLITHITASTGKEGKGLAVTSREGYFLLLFGEKSGGEYGHVRLDDDTGDGFYIRLKNGTIDETKATNYRRGACVDASRITARMRLVAQSTCNSISTLAVAFRNALATYKAQTITEQVVEASASVRTLVFDFATIVLDELTEAEREQASGWEGTMQFIAIDFDLTYTLESCLIPATNGLC